MDLIDVFVPATTPSTILQHRANKPKGRRSCCVPHCSKVGSIIENGKKIVFHRFPSDPKRRQLWIVKIKRDVGPTFKITQSTYVCSRHFKQTDYRYTGGYSGNCYLNGDAVPSVFDCWIDLDKKHIYTPARERRPNKWMSRQLDFNKESSTNLLSEVENNSTNVLDNCEDSTEQQMEISPSNSSDSEVRTTTVRVEDRSVTQSVKISVSEVKCDLGHVKSSIDLVRSEFEKLKIVNQELVKSSKVLSNLNEEIAERDEIIAKKEEIIAQYDTKVTKLNDEIASRDKRLLQQDAEIAKCRKANNDFEDDINKRNMEITFLQGELAKEMAKTAALNEELKQSVFTIDNIPERDVTFYTGLPNIEVFNCLLDATNPGKNGQNIIYSSSVSNAGIKEPVSQVKQGRPRALSPRREFFMWLCRVRLGLFEQDLAYRFQVSKSTVSSILMSWSNFLYLRFGSLNIWPTKQQIKDNMPDDFKAAYPDTRVIIDCTEIPTETPSSLVLQSKSYSNYKSNNTLKSLIGVTPGGHVSFVSSLYQGSISDREITMRSGLLDMQYDKGDSIMADKGFDIQDLLDPLGVQLNRPAFVGKRDQMTATEVRETQQIASLRIHVERWNNKLKNFHIWERPTLLTTAGTVNQMWGVCAYLTLFQDPILSAMDS